MIFCSNCFEDREIKAIIKKLAVKGACPICHNKEAYIYDTDTNTELLEKFEDLLSVYTPITDIPMYDPKNDSKFLVEILKNDWDIFSKSVDTETIKAIIEALHPNLTSDFPGLLDAPVDIAERYNIDYIKEVSILQDKTWTDFVEQIKHKNRFHSNVINTEILANYLSRIEKIIPANKKSRFYRGRISPDSHGFNRSEMGAPPSEQATAGRANSHGISRLYLSYSKDTTLHELRAAEFDYVTIGTFKPQRDIKVVDLKQIGKISPFSPDVDCLPFAINKVHLQKMNLEISKTMRRNDSPLDYVPTQYISDFIMSINDKNGNPKYDGIEYNSAMKNDEANLTIFDPSLFTCTNVQTYEISRLTYKKGKIK